MVAFAGISGTYKVWGNEPSGTYTGTIVIKRQGTIYSAVWTNADGTLETGTGVRTGDILSFVFRKEEREGYGVQVYKISNHCLKGPWAWYGSSWKGIEKLTKIRHKK
jgi:hypothetical protein